VTVTGNTENNYASINEIDIYGFAQKDSDGDGLLDIWEQTGIDTNGDGTMDLNLQAAGADPLHKDLFVEADYMELHKPKTDALAHLVAAFANAPVTNPDNRQGINLHIQVDEQIPHQDLLDLNGLQSIKNTNFGTASERADPNHISILNSKRLVYHYALFAHDQASPYSGSSGRSNGIPSMEFMVTLGALGWGVDQSTGHTVGSIDQQEGTIMHELGHNLNLHHGGADDINCKPNYLSVMSYARQFSSLIGNRPLDYSQSSLAQLNEAGLGEPNGISQSTPPGLTTVFGPASIHFTNTGIPVDWNNNGVTTDTSVNSDIDNLGFSGCSWSANEILNGQDDWQSLKYIAGTFGGANNFVTTSQQNQPEIRISDVKQQQILLLNGIDEAIKKIPNMTFREPSNATALRNSLTQETQTVIGNIATLLKLDQLDTAISKLTDLKIKLYSSLGGNSLNGMTANNTMQQSPIYLINNLIQVLEKQK
jgi:hypothetical protein